MPRGSTHAILAVDDIPSNLLTLRAILPKDEFSFTGAEDAERAFALLESQQFDLILLDVMLPGLDGYAVAKSLKASPRTASIPIIFVTELSNEDEVVKGFAAGGVDFVSKPFRQTELLSRLRTHLALQDKNRALEQAATDLRKANQELSRFLSILAHDLKNPVSGFVSLLQELLAQADRMTQDEMQVVLLTMDQTAKNVHRLLETLLDWGLSRTGSLVLQPEPLPLTFLIEEALEPLTESFRRKKITVTTEAEFQLILGDRYTVVTILRNLLSNAMKFTPTGGSVKILSAVQENEVEIQIQDTGVGIPPTRLNQLFHPEHKVSTHGTDREPGTGLGLILCTEFAAKNGGTLSVASQPGVGTTFVLRLPRIDEAATQALL